MFKPIRKKIVILCFSFVLIIVSFHFVREQFFACKECFYVYVRYSPVANRIWHVFCSTRFVVNSFQNRKTKITENCIKFERNILVVLSAYPFWTCASLCLRLGQCDFRLEAKLRFSAHVQYMFLSCLYRIHVYAYVDTFPTCRNRPDH